MTSSIPLDPQADSESPVSTGDTHDGTSGSMEPEVMTSAGSRYHDEITEAEAEARREHEVHTVERSLDTNIENGTLPPHPSGASLGRADPTPADIDKTKVPGLKERYTGQGGSSSTVDLAMHHPSTSEIEVFSVATAGTPPRHTAYSSLPPSPRHEKRFDYESTPKALGGEFSKYRLHEKLRPLETAHRREVVERLQEGLVKSEKNQEQVSWEDEHKAARVSFHEDRNPGHLSRSKSVDISTPPDESASKIKRPLPSLPTRLKEVPSLFGLIADEFEAEEWDGWIVDGKWERISNFLAIPFAVEKVTLFGALLCLDGFLYNFTILPIRAIVALSQIIQRRMAGQISWSHGIPPSHLHSILRSLLLFIPTVILLLCTDISKMYHSVRGQDTIKLYVIFNALEIADKLCGAFGQDVLDTLFAKDTLIPTRRVGRGRKRAQARPYFFFMLSLGYVLLHTLVFFYMLVSLNVAINSYDYTLLSLLISNQFVEIKGSVFKKFDKENLFQIMCADIVERFQLSLMLSMIAIRNMIEMAGSDLAFLPKSFTKGKSLVDAIMSPVLFVILSEMAVDMLKHAFITKFNHVRASVYGRFTDVLAKDVLTIRSTSGTSTRQRNRPLLLDQSPLVARRLGFAAIPLGCLVLRLSAQAIMILMNPNPTYTSDDSLPSAVSIWLWWTFKWLAGSVLIIGGWGCLVVLKVLLGLSLLSYSMGRQEGMDAREAEDSINDVGRSQVGVSKEETAYYKDTSRHLQRSEDDLPEYSTPGSIAGSPTTPMAPSATQLDTSTIAPSAKTALVDGRPAGSGGAKRKQWRLEEVERWTMVKRIW